MRSYFIDTNYFLRLLLRDNEPQFQKVYELFDQAINERVALYTSIVVFFELNWVLSSFYKKNKSMCAQHLQDILRMNFLEIENRDILRDAFDIFENSTLDLEDSYNVSCFRHKKLNHFATFDKKILKIIS